MWALVYMLARKLSCQFACESLLSLFISLLLCLSSGLCCVIKINFMLLENHVVLFLYSKQDKKERQKLTDPFLNYKFEICTRK